MPQREDCSGVGVSELELLHSYQLTPACIESAKSLTLTHVGEASCQTHEALSQTKPQPYQSAVKGVAYCFLQLGG